MAGLPGRMTDATIGCVYPQISRHRHKTYAELDRACPRTSGKRSQPVESTTPARHQVTLIAFEDVIWQSEPTLFASVSSVSPRPALMDAVVVLDKVLSGCRDGRGPLASVSQGVAAGAAVSYHAGLSKKTSLVPLLTATLLPRDSTLVAEVRSAATGCDAVSETSGI